MVATCSECRWFLAPTSQEIAAWEEKRSARPEYGDAPGVCWPSRLKQDDPRRVGTPHALDPVCGSYEAHGALSKRQAALL